MTEPDPSGGPDVPHVAPVAAAGSSRRLGYWLAVLVALALLVAGGVVALTGYFSQPGPDAVVRSYFAALAGGDAKTALGYGDLPEGDRSYLTAEVLRTQWAVATIRSLRTAPEAGGRVNITYSLGGQHFADSVPVIKKDGRWRLVAVAVRTSVSLSAAGERATFAGTAIPTGQPLLFPGALPIRFDSPNLSLPVTEGVVRFTAGPSSALTVNVSRSGQKIISAEMIKAIRTCVTSPTPAALCPVPSGTGVRAVPASLRGTVVGTPAVAASVAPQADGKLLITGTAKVDGSYQSLDYQNQASAAKGQFDVTFKAHCYASSPGDFVWDAP
jgi:hypothetical protein